MIASSTITFDVCEYPIAFPFSESGTWNWEPGTYGVGFNG